MQGQSLSFFAELKRRNIIRVGIAYASAAWVLMQSLDVVAPLIGLTDAAAKITFSILAIGFIPAMIFAWAFEITPEGLRPAKQVDRTKSITAVTGRKLDLTIIAVLSVAVVLLLVDRYISAPAIAPEMVSEKSIAVLPFVNMSSDSEQEFFSDGITEEILNSLASVKELKVAGRTSSFAFKGKNDDLRQIGETLGVDHILEGSVRKAGTTVRITAQLIQVEDGFHMWSETYDRELTDVFAIQDEIASEILNQLKAKLLDEEIEAVVSQRTTPEVYELYLLAKQRMYSRTRKTIESAVELLDRAIALDPEYAPAYAQRAIATLLLSNRSYGTIAEAEAHKQGKRFIDMALERDSELAEAWAALGLYHANRPSEHEAAVEALTKALSINPNLINASNWLFVALVRPGDARASFDLIEDMVSRDPLYRPAFGNAIQTYNNFGMPDKAEALIEQFGKYDPNDPQYLQALAMHQLYQGNSAEAFRYAERAMELSPTDIVVQMVYSASHVQSGQYEFVADEGLDFFRPNALEHIGRHDEAFDAAFQKAREGYPASLFALYNQSDRSEELIGYLEERWPSLDSFAADHPGDFFGYGLMADIALAYSRAGNERRFEDAMMLVESAYLTLTEQGIDNFGYELESAKFLALAGDYEGAISFIEQSIDGGLRDYAPLARQYPMLAPIASDARFIAAETLMVQHINEDRQKLGLAPIDPLNNLQ